MHFDFYFDFHTCVRTVISDRWSQLSKLVRYESNYVESYVLIYFWFKYAMFFISKMIYKMQIMFATIPTL